MEAHNKNVEDLVEVQGGEEAQAQQAYGIIFSFVPALVLHSALRLRIPDIIASSSLSLHEIASHLPTQSPNLEFLSRILACLSANGILTRSNLGNNVHYALTPTAKRLFLTDNNPASYASRFLLHTDKVLMAPWHHLHECVLEGEGFQAFQRANGKDPWDYAKEHPEINDLLNSAMDEATRTMMKQAIPCYGGFNDLQTLVDVGGGRGTALEEIVKAYPHIHAINFDQPHVVATASTIPGVEHLGGDMFECVPSGEAIFMKNVLHDWDDERCKQILDNCYKALPENGKLILLESMMGFDLEGEGGSGSESVQLSWDLFLKLMWFGATERSQDKYRLLLQNSNFFVADVIAGVSKGIRITEARKLSK